MNKRKLKNALKRIKYLPSNRFLFKYLINKFKHFYFKFTKSTKVAYPSTIMLELTNLCNLACTICPREYEYGKMMDKGQIKIEEAKRIIDELCPYLDSIGLTGMGETFIYNQLEEIVDYIKIKNKGIIISISTNAVLPNFIEKVKKIINKIDTIQISIDGTDNVYESIRKNASFGKFDTNIRELIELTKNSKTDLMLNMVVTKENYSQMPKLVGYASEVGIKYLDFTLFNLASVTEIESNYYEFYKSTEFKIVLEELEKTISENKKVIVTERNFKTENSFKKCPFPWTHFYICWNGFVTPCCVKPFPKELNFGNVFDNNVLSVLNSKEFRNFRTLWFNNKAPKFCDKCHFIHIEPIKS